jgi:hypothetical protein
MKPISRAEPGAHQRNGRPRSLPLVDPGARTIPELTIPLESNDNSATIHPRRFQNPIRQVTIENGSTNVLADYRKPVIASHPQVAWQSQLSSLVVGNEIATLRSRSRTSEFRIISTRSFSADTSGVLSQCIANLLPPVHTTTPSTPHSRGRRVRGRGPFSYNHFPLEFYLLFVVKSISASGINSAGRVPASQAGCRGFDPRIPLH